MMSYNQQMVLNSSKFSNLLIIPLACLDVKSTAVVLPLSAVDNAAFSPNRLAGLLDSMNPSYLMKKDASWYLHFKRVILLTFHVFLLLLLFCLLLSQARFCYLSWHYQDLAQLKAATKHSQCRSVLQKTSLVGTK
jgi:hypothetical protein